MESIVLYGIGLVPNLLDDEYIVQWIVSKYETDSVMVCVIWPVRLGLKFIK